ncbi:MAG: undecaprenyldiphospho-muramoylpentapeptide beta-N-acetylglucosaminyltransferase [bacterium]
MKVMFACGGTGGHIYPAIAVADALKKKYGTRAQLLFVGSDYGMEKSIIEKAGYAFKGVPARPLVRKWTLKNISNLFFTITAVIKAAEIVKKFAPDCVFGTGGFVSFPPLIAAALMGKKTVIHEPNAVPGIANKLLAPFVTAVTVGMKETAAKFQKGKAVVTGNPVRASLLGSTRKKAAAKFGLKTGAKTLLIMPGSRAAKSVNAAVEASLPLFEKNMKGLQLIWMCGSEAFTRAKKIATKFKTLKIKPFEFIHNAADAYAMADAGVLRAGAGTLAEIIELKFAAILVPYPYATAKHQEANAKVLLAHGAAKVIQDSELTGATLYAEVKEIMEKKNNSKIKLALAKMKKGDSVGNIIKVML